MHTHTHNHYTVIHPHKLLGLDGSEYQCIISNTILKWYCNEYLIDYGIQPSATGDMIVIQGTSILIASIIFVMGIMTNRTTQTLVPDSARDIAFKTICHGNRLSNK